MKFAFSLRLLQINLENINRRNLYNMLPYYYHEQMKNINL